MYREIFRAYMLGHRDGFYRGFAVGLTIATLIALTAIFAVSVLTQPAPAETIKSALVYIDR